LSGADDPVLFDIDADGTPNRITWTARNSAVAFLAMDRNDNVAIDDGSELFGTSTRLHSGAEAANGFEALKDLDSNGDGFIGPSDTEWGALLLWTDSDHDGISQPQELRSIALSPVQAIETRYHWIGRRDSAGNIFGYRGFAHFLHGRRPIYDVFFVSVP
jgi:hypothetical protein